MRRSAFKRFGFSVVAVAAVLVLHLALAPWLGDSGLFLLFTPAVMFSAWYGGLGPGLLSMALSVAAGWNFLMAPGGLSIDDWDRLALFLIVGGAVTWLQVKIASSTDRIQALLERAQEARAEAEAANRAKDEFLATVSHELRAPLSVVIGWASVLRRDPGAGAVVNRAADAIESNARLQARLVEDILDSVRASRG
ncbi:MAG TPA: histidine kinase dimerization/phospho-acceptor domain-containing protein, partial [Vicinamibacterales bacterium]